MDPELQVTLEAWARDRHVDLDKALPRLRKSEYWKIVVAQQRCHASDAVLFRLIDGANQNGRIQPVGA